MAATKVMIDHGEIRRWTEERRGRAASVRKTGGRGGQNDIGMLTLDMPGFAGEESLRALSWEEWFRQFDRNNLALVVQDEAASGQKSNFNKLVSRDSVEVRSARRHRNAGRATRRIRSSRRPAARGKRSAAR
jgi:hypothetical protein